VDSPLVQSVQHTILVVEDRPPLRGLLKETLEAVGYCVLEAWNGAQAIEAVDRHLALGDPLCLVLLDMLLPYVDGLEVLRHLAECGSHVPVVAISAHPALLEAAAASGVQSTLAKPFELDQVLATVRNYCPMP
jgi:CheY-like chemotaxis protein